MKQSTYMLQLVIAVVLIAAVPSTARNVTRRARQGRQPREGSATIEGSLRSGASIVEMDTELLLSPMSMPTAPFGQPSLTTAGSSSSPAAGEYRETPSEAGDNLPLAAAAAATPQAKANMKRIFLLNKCGCRSNSSTSAPYPIVALSYQPVQSVDFYTIGYWSMTSCKKTYVIATTNSVVYMSAEMSDGSVAWTGDISLTVYVPSQNTCEAQRKFKEYKLPANWNDHTINLTC